MLKKSFSILTFMALAVALMGCGGAEAATVAVPKANPQIVLRISGAGNTSIILRAVKPQFEAATPGYRLEVLPGSGTSGGVQGALQGVLDAAAMSRPPKADETARSLKYKEFGNAGVAVFTHLDVDITSLTAAQFGAIFMGEVSNWAEVGGPNLPIIRYVRDDRESATRILRQSILGDTPFPVRSVQVLTGADAMLTAVEGTPGSVGFGLWPGAVAKNAQVHPIALNNILPTDPAYPLVTPLGIGYRSDHQAKVQPLLEWLSSERGQAALRGFAVIARP